MICSEGEVKKDKLKMISVYICIAILLVGCGKIKDSEIGLETLPTEENTEELTQEKLPYRELPTREVQIRTLWGYMLYRIAGHAIMEFPDQETKEYRIAWYAPDFNFWPNEYHVRESYNAGERNILSRIRIRNATMEYWGLDPDCRVGVQRQECDAATVSDAAQTALISIEGTISRYLSDGVRSEQGEIEITYLTQNLGGIIYYVAQQHFEESGSIEGTICGTYYMMSCDENKSTHWFFADGEDPVMLAVFFESDPFNTSVSCEVSEVSAEAFPENLEQKALAMVTFELTTTINE